MSSHAGRILTTHVGSLPRPLDVTTTIFKAERGEFVDKAEHEKIIERAVHDIVGRQVDSGVDIVRVLPSPLAAPRAALWAKIAH